MSLQDFIDETNLVDQIPDIDKVSQDLQEGLQTAKQSMTEWLEKYKKAIDLATLNPETKEKTFPFEGASVIMHPAILDAMTEFHALTTPDLVYADKVTHIKINGDDVEVPNVPEPSEEELAQMMPEEQQQVSMAFAEASQMAAAIAGQKEALVARGERVETFMNYQLSNLIPKWRKTQDKAMLMLPCVGTLFKKIYYDTDIKQVRSELVTPDNLIFDHNCDDFSEVNETYEPLELSRNDVISKIRGDDWDIDESDLNDDQKTFKFYECQIWADMDEDGLSEPYIAIWYEQESKIVSIKANYDEDSINENDEGEVVNVEPIEYYIQYTFMPDPAGGCMGMGWGILLSDMFTAINTNLRQLIDASTLQIVSANSGLIDVTAPTGKGNRIQSGPMDVKMGQLTKVQPPAGRSLRESVVQFPFAGASPQMFQLMEYLVQSAKELTVAAYNTDANPNEAAQMYLARLQQAMKKPNSIMMRVYSCMKEELTRIFNLNYEHYDNELYEKVLNTPADMAADFYPDDCDITTLANPMQGSQIERVAKAQAVYEMSLTDPKINGHKALTDLLEVMKVADVEALAPLPDPNYVDPQQEIFLAQQQFQAELMQQDMQIKQQKVAVEELRLAKEFESLLADIDKTESETTKNYAQTIELITRAKRENALAILDDIKIVEERFQRQRGEEDDTRAVNNAGLNRDMANITSNQGLPS